jgi:hypothetical protein
VSLIDAEYFNSQTTTLGLKSSFTPPADVLTVLIGEASEWIAAYCRRQFGAQSITESRQGSGRRRMILNEFPAESVTAITAVDTRGVATTDVPDPSDVRILPGGMLEMKDAADVWFKDYYYTVTYTLPDPVPGPVKRAVALKVVDLLDPMYFPGKQKSMELVTSVQEQIVTLLEDYRRERIG